MSRRVRSRASISKRGPLTWREFKTEKLTPAFRELRDGGIFARTNKLACCGSCTQPILNKIVDDSDGMYDGYVGYHIQSVPEDADGWLKPFDAIYLNHGLPDDEGVVQFVRKVFVKRGLAVEWTGEADKTVHVRLPKTPGPLWDLIRTHVRMRGIFWYWHSLTHSLHAAGDAESDKRQRSNIRWDPDAPDAPPAGVDPAFNDLSFTRDITFHKPYGLSYNRELGEDMRQLSFYRHGGHVKSLSLSPPCRYEKDDFVELKGAELDAIAFRGHSIAFETYATLGGDFTGTKRYKAPSGKTFTVAELYAILEKHLFWIARVEQVQKKLNLDHRFFEGLFETMDGFFAVKWGS